MRDGAELDGLAVTATLCAAAASIAAALPAARSLPRAIPFIFLTFSALSWFQTDRSRRHLIGSSGSFHAPPVRPPAHRSCAHPASGGHGFSAALASCSAVGSKFGVRPLECTALLVGGVGGHEIAFVMLLLQSRLKHLG